METLRTSLHQRILDSSVHVKVQIRSQKKKNIFSIVDRQKLPNEIHSGVFHMVYYSIIAVVNLSIIQLPLAVLFFRKEYTDCARQKQVCGKERSLCLTRHKSGKGFLNLEKQRI